MNRCCMLCRQEETIIVVHIHKGSERFPLHNESVENHSHGTHKKREKLSSKPRAAAEVLNMCDCGFVPICYQQSLVCGPYVILACTVIPAGTMK